MYQVCQLFKHLKYHVELSTINDSTNVELLYRDIAILGPGL